MRIDAIWRLEAPRVIARVARMTGDLAVAEELAQDAFVAALERWPADGVPLNPGAWLTATAKNRAVDWLRRAGRFGDKQQELVAIASSVAAPDLEGALDEPVRDDLLRLVFVACHPVLSPEARVALTLRLVAGLTTQEIARAFLSTEPTIAQRIVRAKRTLADAGVPFEVPSGDALTERLGTVLGVVYLVYNEGYSATAGDQWVRPELCEEALRLGRILAELAPGEPEVHGLVALMEIQSSRVRARVGPGGEPILLLDQDRARWDGLLIRRGLAAIARAQALGRPPGPFVLQAEIAACHARAARAEHTDWPRIVALYAALAEIAPSPIVELNRAVAVAAASGPEAGLRVIEPLRELPALRSYHLLPAVRAELLARLGRRDEARAELVRAADLAQNRREQDLLRERARILGGATSDR